MKLQILSFEWNVFKSQEVVSVNLMTKIWEITILQNHSPIITSLKPGVVDIVYIWEDNQKYHKYFAIWTWVLECFDNQVKILIDMLVWVENFDENKAL